MSCSLPLFLSLTSPLLVPFFLPRLLAPLQVLFVGKAVQVLQRATAASGRASALGTGAAGVASGSKAVSAKAAAWAQSLAVLKGQPRLDVARLEVAVEGEHGGWVEWWLVAEQFLIAPTPTPSPSLRSPVSFSRDCCTRCPTKISVLPWRATCGTWLCSSASCRST